MVQKQVLKVIFIGLNLSFAFYLPNDFSKSKISFSKISLNLSGSSNNGP